VDAIPPVEREIGFDLVRRAALIAPAVLIIAFVIAGVEGLAGAAIALALVALNFLAGAFSLQWAEKRGAATLAAVAVGGFLVRMSVVLGVILLVRDTVNMACLLTVLLVSHVGLLAWESKSLSISLAAPGLRPAAPNRVAPDKVGEEL
jgi:hypothetical protein